MVILENISLASHTTFGIGGRARYFVEVASVKDLEEACDFARSHRLPMFVLGGGSNVLVSDNGFPGIVIQNRIKGIHESHQGDVVTVDAGAGEPWDAFVAYCVERGYWGIENLSLIPGTVGAAPVQNIGAYGREVKDVIESVTIFDPVSGEERKLSNEQCAFAYRDSLFKRETARNYIITSVSFKLSLVPGPNVSYKDLAEYFTLRKNAIPSLANIRGAVIDIRTEKFPDLAMAGTAGSFWKNPIISTEAFKRLQALYPGMPAHPAGPGLTKVPLAWILDNVCNLKGFSKGSIRLFSRQPLVLVAGKDAKTKEILAFAAEIEALIKDKTGIDVEKEVFVLE